MKHLVCNLKYFYVLRKVHDYAAYFVQLWEDEFSDLTFSITSRSPHWLQITTPLSILILFACIYSLIF